MFHVRVFLASLIALLTIAGGATAGTWLQAETDHFIVRGEVSERTLRKWTLKLSAFDAVMRANYPAAVAGREPQKVHVYLVNGRRPLQAVSPGVSPAVAGFYNLNTHEPFLIADVSASGRDVERAERVAEVILFHEYAHHFMRAYLPGAVPAWLSEGWAEYFGATEIDDDKVVVGGNARGGVLFSDWLPMEQVFAGRPTAGDQANRFYAQAWIFTHYMQATPERAAQLARILDLVGQGQPSAAAVQTVTGMDMATLARTLKGYTRLTTMTFDNPLKTAPAITVTPMPDAADDVQLDWLHAARGCRGDEGFVERLRAKAAQHADDPYAQRILAQAEFQCGDAAAGEAIVDRLLAKAPNDLDALRIGALNLAYLAARTPSRRAELFQKARTFAARGYALDKADAPLLYAYVLARRVQPGYPTANDVASIKTAMALSPSVSQIILLGGEVLLRSGRRDEGRALLMEVANNPHGGPMAAFARRLLERDAADVGEALTAAGKEGPGS